MPFPKNLKYTADEYFNMGRETNLHIELRDGEIVDFASPTVEHQRIVGVLYSKILGFIDKNKGKCEPFISPLDVKLDDYNVVQPDVFVFCDPSKYDEVRCYGAPDWCIEVLSANRSDDLVDKLSLYSKHGVREYWIVDPKNRKTLVYCFEKSDLPSIYTFDSAVPVGIYNGELSITINDLI